MFIAYITIAALFSVLLGFSAFATFTKEKSVADTLTRVGVPLRMFPVLGALKLAGMLGLLAGIGFRPLGIAAAVGLALFFLGAFVAHAKAKDYKGIAVPTILTLVSGGALGLAFASI